MLGVPPERVFEALQVYLGSAFVNDFNLLGRTYRVTAQADAPFRDTTGRHRQPARPAPIRARWCRSARSRPSRTRPGPIASCATTSFPAVEVDGDTAPGYLLGPVADDDGEARRRDAAAPATATNGPASPISRRRPAAPPGIVFALAVLFVFLVLAAQYESLVLPLAIILIVPMCLLAAMAGVNLRGMDNNVLTQIGLVVLIALAAKNAILVVEFAKQAEEQDGLVAGRGRGPRRARPGCGRS